MENLQSKHRENFIGDQLLDADREKYRTNFAVV
jgi:hypothetical protein